jgi:hypothetical protein
MNPMVYASFDLQHNEINRIRRGFTFPQSVPVRDRLVRVLISLGCQLVTGVSRPRDGKEAALATISVREF